MPINPSIILGVKPAEIAQPDALGQAQKILTLKHLMQQGDLGQLQYETAKQGVSDDAAVRKAYIDSGGDNDRARALLVQGGQYKQVQALDDAALARRQKETQIKESEAKAAKDAADTQIKALEHVSGALSYAKENPAAWPQVRQIIAKTFPNAPPLPEQFDPQFVDMTIAQGQSLAQRLADQRAREQITETGRHNRTTESNTIRGQDITAGTARDVANLNAEVSTQNTNTNLGDKDQLKAPQIGSNSATVRPAPGQMQIPPEVQRVRDTDAIGLQRQELARETALLAQATDPKQKAQHAENIRQLNIELGNKVPATKPTAGAEVSPSLSARERAKTKEDKPLTETAGKAAGMALRAQRANDILNMMEEQGETNRGLIKQAAGALPLIGGGAEIGVNMLPSYLGGPSQNQQKVEQARRDFVNAALRVESGAAISDGEFRNAEKQYFPMPGDTPEVIAQKRKSRANEIEALRIQAGAGEKRVTSAVHIKGDDGYNALPKGAHYIGPDGVERVK